MEKNRQLCNDLSSLYVPNFKDMCVNDLEKTNIPVSLSKLYDIKNILLLKRKIKKNHSEKNHYKTIRSEILQ